MTATDVGANEIPRRTRKKARSGISVTVLKAGEAKAGTDVIFTTTSSNHYTSASFTADTCCSCAQ